MKKQMEMFQDGGLEQDGGTIDPESGNEVPMGSAQEEVRDDVPARLSEGEFVFPADVVRFIGLEKLMNLRQQAKAGLQRMEEMGQMGNSDEATISDDVPFDINDLDIEEETEYNRGGVIQAQTGTFVNPNPNITTMPSQFDPRNYNPVSQPYASSQQVNTSPITSDSIGVRPLTSEQSTASIATPSFESFVGTGGYDELKKYTNDAGMILQIPFKNGEPLYPIPEGYKYEGDFKPKTTEETTVAPTAPQQVAPEKEETRPEDKTGSIVFADATNEKTQQKTLTVGMDHKGNYYFEDVKTGARQVLTEDEAKALNADYLQQGKTLIGKNINNFAGENQSQTPEAAKIIKYKINIKKTPIYKFSSS